MSSYHFVNKENTAINAQPLKEKNSNIQNNNNGVKKISLKDSFGTPTSNENSFKSKANLIIKKGDFANVQNKYIHKNSERVPLGGKPVNKNNADQNQKTSFIHKDTFKKSDSLLLPGHNLKKKIQVQKDEDTATTSSNITIKSSPLKRRKIKSKTSTTSDTKTDEESKSLSTEQLQHKAKVEDEVTELEYVPPTPEPLPYVPDNYTPLTESDLEFFKTKNPIPQKSTNIKEVDEELDKFMSFDEIPDIDISIGQLEDYNKENINDSLVKKQPKILQNCNVKLDDQNIPDLHFSTEMLNSGARSPLKRTFSEASDDNDEGLSREDLESLIM